VTNVEKLITDCPYCDVGLDPHGGWKVNLVNSEVALYQEFLCPICSRIFVGGYMLHQEPNPQGYLTVGYHKN